MINALKLKVSIRNLLGCEEPFGSCQNKVFIDTIFNLGFQEAYNVPYDTFSIKTLFYNINENLKMFLFLEVSNDNKITTLLNIDYEEQ